MDRNPIGFSQFRRRIHRTVMGCVGAVLLGVQGCGPLPSSETQSSSSGGGGASFDCSGIPAPSGTPWVPHVAGVSASHADSTVTVSTTSSTSSRVFVGYMNSVLSTVTFNFSVDEDLGPEGSLSLVAEPVNVDSTITNAGAAVYPVLVELTAPAPAGGSVQEFVKLQGCSSGFFSCTGSSCTRIESCAPAAGSAFAGASEAARRIAFDERQNLRTSNQVSVNLFPTCNWTETAAAGSDTIDCPFKSTDNNSFFQNGKLRTGAWTAKYALVSQFIQSSQASGGALSTMRSGLKLTVLRKKDFGGTVSGSRSAIDLNVVLVGSQNIADSRTEKGKQNLDLLFGHVVNHYVQSDSQVRVRAVNAFEWDCSRGGDVFANATTSEAGALFSTGSLLLSAPYSDPARGVNLFLLSSFSDSTSILGLAGGIPGAPIAGTTTSGAVIATQGDLANFNPSCTPGVSCPASSQEAFFLDMGVTVAHELGHFLGLNHPSEASGARHDRVQDTPICTVTGGSGLISHSSCRSSTNLHPVSGNSCLSQCGTYNPGAGLFCSASEECGFNHLMWWTSKNFRNGVGDGNLLSPHTGHLLNYSPYAR